MVKPVTDDNACTTSKDQSPTAGVTCCRVCGRVFTGWDDDGCWEDGKRNASTYWIGKQACSDECVLEAGWRDSLQNLNLDYYPDPRRYDKLGRRLHAPG